MISRKKFICLFAHLREIEKKNHRNKKKIANEMIMCSFTNLILCFSPLRRVVYISLFYLACIAQLASQLTGKLADLSCVEKISVKQIYALYAH